MKPLQNRLIEQLKQSVPSNASIADELATLLNVSIDSAYRRLRGETALSIDEAAILCKRFNISIDSLLNTSQDLVTFNYKAFAKTEGDIKLYIDNILIDLQKITAFKNKEVSFAAEDIPIFHHFEFKELTAFKFYYWQKAILLSKELQNTKFDVSLINPEIIKNSNEVYKLYRNIPSQEIWTTETIYSSLKQIEFFFEAGHFNKKEDALIICNQIRMLVTNLQNMAEGESKNDGFDKNFKLYCSDVMIGNNSVLINIENQLKTYLSFNTFNTLTTTNIAFCSETEIWMKNLIKKSDLISGVAEKQRAKFFKILHHLISKTEQMIQQD